LGRYFFNPFSYSVPHYYPAVYPTYQSTTYIQNYDDDLPYEQLDDDAFLTEDGVTVSPVEPQAQQQVAEEASTPEEAVELGVTAFGQGRFEDARRALVSALLAAPEDPELIMLYAYAHFATGDYLISALSLKQAMELDDTLIAKPIDLYGLYGDPSQFEAHLAKLDDYIEAHPEDADARFVAGYARYAAGDPVSAKVYFDSVDNDGAGTINQRMLEAASRAIEMISQGASGAGTTQPSSSSEKGVIISEPTPE